MNFPGSPNVMGLSAFFSLLNPHPKIIIETSFAHRTIILDFLNIHSWLPQSIPTDALLLDFVLIVGWFPVLIL